MCRSGKRRSGRMGADRGCIRVRKKARNESDKATERRSDDGEMRLCCLPFVAPSLRRFVASPPMTKRAVFIASLVLIVLTLASVVYRLATPTHFDSDTWKAADDPADFAARRAMMREV